jgi:hypothetical protein
VHFAATAAALAASTSFAAALAALATSTSFAAALTAALSATALAAAIATAAIATAAGPSPGQHASNPTSGCQHELHQLDLFRLVMHQ